MEFTKQLLHALFEHPGNLLGFLQGAEEYKIAVLSYNNLIIELCNIIYRDLTGNSMRMYAERCMLQQTGKQLPGTAASLRFSIFVTRSFRPSIAVIYHIDKNSLAAIQNIPWDI